MTADPQSILERLRPACARVDLTRLRANYHAVATAADRPLMPVVKADAYGHGAGPVARVLQDLGAPMLAVAYVEEGVVLRAAGMTVPIVVLGGFTSAQAPIVVEHRLIPVVSTRGMLEAAVGTPAPLTVHLKVDTGMTRLGFPPTEAIAAAERLAAAPNVRLEGLMTHLACADESREVTETQLDRFDAVVEELARRGLKPPWVHAANSAGLLALRPAHTLVRPGLLLYGLRPRPLSPEVDVSPVMSVSARIARIADIPPGTAVSYGGRWVAARPSRIATLPIGYADAVPRTSGMSERGWLSVAGGRAPVAGAVCMDLTMLDVTDLPQAGEADEAVLFGDEPTAWDVAGWAGTTAWQVLTSVGPRVPRAYVEDGRVVAVESRYVEER